ncbi:Prolyl 4-hydroxylase subunit [Dirofilaria immitis]
MSKILTTYISTGMSILNMTREDYTFGQEIQERNDKVIQNDEQVIRHPINVFLLINKITADWNKQDLLGAIIGLLRLQDTYQMDTKDIAEGKVLNSQMRKVTLTTGDCFEIGHTAYRISDYYHTILWIQEARERVEKEVVPAANLEHILEYLAFSLYKQDNLKRDLLLTDELYRMNPNHPDAKDNVGEYENLLKNYGVRLIDMRRDIPPINNA